MAQKNDKTTKAAAAKEKAPLPRLQSNVTVAPVEKRTVTGIDKEQTVTVDKRIRRLIEDGDLVVVATVKPTTKKDN